MLKPRLETKLSQTILFSLYFFLFFGAIGFITPFLNLHFYNIGLTGIQIGTITTVSALCGLLVSPVICAYFDRMNHKRSFFQIILLISGISLFLIGWTQLIYPIALLIILNHIGNSSNLPISENLSFRITTSVKGNSKLGFGFMRQFGSIAFALTAIIGGLVFEFSGIKVNFFLYFIFMLLIVILVFFISDTVFKSTNEHRSNTENIHLKDVLKTVVSDKYLFLLVAALAITHPLGNGIRQFEPIFMSQLHLRESMIGLAATLAALGEIPFFLWADQLISRLGITKLLIFVFIIDLLRRILVFAFPVGWVVFVMHVATCISFSLRLVTTIKLINQSVPEKYSTTALSLVTMTFFGISNMVSTAISGFVFDAFGGQMLYLISALGCVISLVMAYHASRHEQPV
jgi:MFS family permease